MSGSNLSVKITADIVDLQTKFAVAKAEVSGLTGEMNKLARASAAGVIDSAGQAKLQQVAGDLLHAKSNAASLAGAMQAAGVGTSMFGRSAAEAGEHSATAVRYIRELFDEISSGRTRYLPSTLAALGQSALHMNLAMLASVGGVGAFVAALGYLGVKAVEASHEISEIKLGADFAGNLTLSRAAIQQFVSELSSAVNVSSKDATKMAAALAEIPGMTAPELQAIEPLISSYVRSLDDNAGEAQKALKKFFEPTESAAAVAKLLNASEALREMAQAADLSGNANEVAAAKIQLLEGVLTPMTHDLAATVHGYLDSAEAALKWFGNVENGMTPMQATAERIRETTQALEQQTVAVRARAAALAATPATPQQTLQLGMSVAQGENPISQQMDEAKSKISEMTAALNVAKAAGDRLEVNTLNAGIDAARQKLTELAQEQNRAAQQWVTEFNRDQEQMRTEASQIAQSEFQESTRYLQQEVQAEQQAANQKQQIARIDADAAIQISRQKLEAAKETLQEEVEATRGAAAQKYAALKQLTTQEAALDIEQLQNERSALAQEPVEAARVDAQILELKQQLVTKLAQLDEQAAQASKKAVQQDSEFWKSSVNEIESAESRLTSALISRRQSLSASLLQIGSQMLTQEIANDLKAFTTKLVLQDSQKAAEQGGLIYHEIVELQKAGQTQASQTAQTAATLTGTAARTAATATGAASSTAIAAATGTKTVMQDAAKAFSGTYASVAQIPYVGWILAPAAAAAAFAAVAAYQGMASLDVGTPYVPKTGLYTLHEGEAVAPKTWAQGLRDGDLRGGMGAAGGNAEMHTHLHLNVSAIDGDSVKQWFDRPRTRTQLVSALQAHYNRGARLAVGRV